MSNNKQSSVDAYCNGCNAFICDELVTFEETCSNCGTQIEYFEDKMSKYKLSSVYAVTGVDHGSIVTAMNEQQAIEIFQKVYDGEEIICVKDITNYNLENL